MEITRGIIKSAQKVVVYGPEGVGKSLFASMFPNPVFSDTEGSTKNIDVNRLPDPTSWALLMQEAKYIRQNPNKCDTYVIDTADWAERLCSEYICTNAKVAGIEDFGWGKGYTYLEEEFGRLLDILTDIVKKDVNVVLTAHAWMRKIEQPEENGGYDHWELKCEKKVSALIKEWADMILFANYKTLVVNVDGQGAQKGKNKAQGGKRVMYTTHTPWWDAKNRHDLPDELPFEFASIAHCIPDRQEVVNSSPQPQQNTPDFSDEKVKELFKATEISNDDTQINLEVTEVLKDISPSNHKLVKAVTALEDLMKINDVSIDDITDIVAKKGYYPADTPISNYDPDFIMGVLVGAWDQVYTSILSNKNIA